MAQNVVINEVVYQNVPSVDIPKSTGGTAKFYDTASGNVTANDMRASVKGFGANGEVTGNLAEISATAQKITTKNQVINIAAGIHTGGGTVQIDESAVADCVASNIPRGKSILGVDGALSSAIISQDSTTKVLSIS